MKTDYVWRHLMSVVYEEAYNIEFLNYIGAYYDTKAIINSLKDKLMSVKSELDQAKSAEELIIIRDKYEEIIKTHFVEADKNAMKPDEVAPWI